jgi:calcineurin-like phosphoesterase family protein
MNGMKKMKNKRKPIFFTSDWHLYHVAVLKFCERPFKDIEHMHQVLVNNYNAVVPEHGICYFVGDMGMYNVDLIKPIIDSLNGTKVLILGNHDPGVNASYNMGFDIVVHGITMKIAGEMVTITHCPLLETYREDTSRMKGDKNPYWHGHNNKKHRELSTKNNGQFHIHGHIHSPNRGQSKKIQGKQYDVGVDAHNFRPVSISTIESFIATNK